MVLIAFTVVTDENLNTLTEVMNALVNLQAQEQAKGAEVKENPNKGITAIVIGNDFMHSSSYNYKFLLHFRKLLHTCSYLIHPHLTSNIMIM